MSAQTGRDPDETRDILELIAECFPEPQRWLSAPNEFLGGAKPRDLIGTPNEIRVRELARSVKHGMFT